jgi:hypothetical protein
LFINGIIPWNQEKITRDGNNQVGKKAYDSKNDDAHIAPVMNRVPDNEAFLSLISS